MDVILYGLVTVLLAMAVFQAFRLHRHYTGTLYPALFANYLEYFWRYQFRQNLSVSSWLKQELGFHRRPDVRHPVVYARRLRYPRFAQ